jgi:hypothetical protein
VAKPRVVRNRELHDALRAFATDAAAVLVQELNSGCEVEFDLEGDRGHGPTLYHYKPLTAKFIGERWRRLSALPTCPAAAEALGAGAQAFLRVNGLRGAEAEPALRAMLERLYQDATDFRFPEERFERLYAEVERTLFVQSQRATVVVPVHGLELVEERVDLDDGVALERGDRSDAPDEERCHDPNALVTLTRDLRPDDPLPVAEARKRFRGLLTGLRLWKPGGVALAGVAWRRTGDGSWQPFELEATGFPRGGPWILVEGEDAGLRGFLDAIERRPVAGPVAWALARFEMGCGRRTESEALSDYLLALRALVEPGGESGRSSLALRVAVLCAEEDERMRVRRRVELAQALERFVMGDGPDDPYLDAVGGDSPRTLVDEVERHLRALLRDVMCGYLDSDLRSVADELLLDRAGTAEPAPVAPAPPTPPATRTAAAAPRGSERGPLAIEIETLEDSTEEIGVVEAEIPATPPEDAAPPELDLDDDPADYCSPV